MALSLDGVLIKKAHKKEHYTIQQMKEVALCSDPVTGPEYFMSNFFMIQHPVKGRMQYKPFEYQKRLIDTYHNYRFSISMMPRQSGKSTSAAGYLLWYAMFVADSTVLIAAHKYSGAQEIMQRIRYAYENCADHIRAGATSYNKGSIEFDNGSRIVAQTTTETTGRGMSISLLYCDELAFVRPTVAVEFWTSISPTLSTGGRALITSTPNSDEDQFATIWKGANNTVDDFGNELKGGLGKNGFRAYRAYWDEHPDRDEEWANEERGRIGDERFRREIGCEFIIADETLINSSTLAEMAGIQPVHKEGQVRWYQQPKKGLVYCIALDPALGTGGDYSAIQVYEANTATQVAEWRHNGTDIQSQIRLLASIADYIYEKTKDPMNIYYSVENNTLGEAALISIAEYGEENIPGTFLSEPGKGKMGNTGRRLRKGFTTTNKSKLSACAKLKHLVEKGRMKINSIPLISEFKTFVAVGNTYEAKMGSTDDLVMATVLAVRMFQLLQGFHAELDENLRDHTDEVIKPMPFIVVF